MAGIAHAYTGSFGNTALERIDLNAPPELAGATFDWAADSLPVGALTDWQDLTAGHSWRAYGGVSVISDGAGGRAVSTDGVDGLLLKDYAATGPETIVMVARYWAMPTNGALLMNTVGPDIRNVGVASSGTGYISNAGKSVSAGTGQPFTDTNYHVLITCFDGANSSVMVDGAEQVGVDLGTNPRTGFRAGYGASYSKINYRRVVRLPYIPTASQRQGIRTMMQQLYGL